MEVVGIKFKNNSKLYYFLPNGLKLSENDKVVVETPNGKDIAFVKREAFELTEEFEEPLKPILRIATKKDIADKEKLEQKRDNVLLVTRELISSLKLDMKIVDVEFTLDGLDRQWDREKRQNALRTYADKGIVLDPTMWASALGMKPQDFQRSLECAHNSNFVDNLTMLLNVNTMKDGGMGDNEVGAPEKEGLEKSDKTEEVQDDIN